MRRFSLTCFGVGDGLPCADRNHAAFLYRFGATSILLDCGEPVDRCFKAGGWSYDLPDAIFLSHLHADHFGGFFMLVQGTWLEGRRKNLPVYLPSGAVDPVRALLRAACLHERLLRFRLRFAPLVRGKTVALRQVRITPFRTTHLDQLRAALPKPLRRGLESYCFLLESGRRRIGHSADLGKPEDLEPLLEQPLDLLVCELAHFSPEEIFRYLRGRPIRRVVFVHLAGRYWHDLGKIRRLAAKLLPDTPHSFPKDGAVIQF
jgi:ribonuclease BN (tRNA processing enzyme)